MPRGSPHFNRSNNRDQELYDPITFIGTLPGSFPEVIDEITPRIPDGSKEWKKMYARLHSI
jgi:hypothetical protein